ncbi:MAG: alpha/beta hydrolase [Clostridia bacterium]|nr:alpha/beta hydrolase [Clostridia bacterium]
MVETFSMTLPRLTGKEKRRVYAYIPQEARRNPEARFPVLYMFDGHNVFFDRTATYGKSWGMKTYMDQTRTPLIIIAVDCNHAPDYGRLKEYAPFSFEDPGFGRIEGKGQKYMQWMVETLKPYVDERYPTLPDRGHTMIAGSSMGGLMTVYALAAFGDTFSRGAALSPSLWTSPRSILRLIRTSPHMKGCVMYMDYGSQELQNHEGMLKIYRQVQDACLEAGTFLTSRIVPMGEHCEACWEQQIPFFMQTLFYHLPEAAD